VPLSLGNNHHDLIRAAIVLVERINTSAVCREEKDGEKKRVSKMKRVRWGFYIFWCCTKHKIGCVK